MFLLYQLCCFFLVIRFSSFAVYLFRYSETLQDMNLKSSINHGFISLSRAFVADDTQRNLLFLINTWHILGSTYSLSSFEFGGILHVTH